MWRYIFVTLGLSVVLLALDYYVYRNWRRFADYRGGRLRLTLPVYRVLMFVMPLALPVYFYFSRWWEVEPKLPRAIFFGLWTLYYLPKVIIALALLLKDFARFVMWLFEWFKVRLQRPEPDPAGSEAVPDLDLSDMKRMTRKEFLQTAGWSLAAVPFVTVGYSVFRSLYDFQVHHVEVKLANLPRQLDGLTIAQLSDLHAGSFFSPKPMEEAAALVNSLHPDLIMVTGDYVNNDAAEAPIILPALRTFKADLGVFGCLGNHDHYANVTDVMAALRTTPIDLLVNEHRTLNVDGAKLHVIGTDNTGFRQRFADLPRALEGIEHSEPGDEVCILLAHDPTFWDNEVRPNYPDIDLMVCGHTHGGQVGFEFGPLRWGLARLMYERWAGLYTEARPTGTDPQYLYVNRGLGTVGPPLRIGVQPEVTLLTLRKA